MQVIKRDGSKEEFDKNKISRVIAAAGVERKQAENLARKVAFHFQEKMVNEITSHEIRDRVLTELKKVNSYAAGLYRWYEKKKDEEKA